MGEGLGSKWHFRVKIVIEYLILTFENVRKFSTSKIFRVEEQKREFNATRKICVQRIFGTFDMILCVRSIIT